MTLYDFKEKRVSESLSVSQARRFLSSFFRNWCPVIFWMGLISYLSSLPGDQIPSVPLPQIDKAVHFVEYAILGALLLRAFINSGVGSSPWRALFFTWIVAGGFAFSDEWHQSFVAGRSSEWLEVGLDALFSLAGMMGFFYLRFGRKQRSEQRRFS